MNIFQDKHILVGISGGIAAYKSLELIRTLKTYGAEVNVVLTEYARKFVTPLSIHALTGNRPYSELYDEHSQPMDHINLAKWADLIVIAPASANILAKLANGICDDLLSTLCTATVAKIMLVPAMNQQMWQNPAIEANVQQLLRRQFGIIGPEHGEQACGDIGPGRMTEPKQIIEQLAKCFAPATLSGKHFLVTAGPTYEPIDPVRFIGNHSSGKMGYALANSLLKAGAQVTLISGPTSIDAPRRAKVIKVTTCQEMQIAVNTNLNGIDAFISCAAVADHRAADISPNKLKKSGLVSLGMIKNPDILKQVSLSKRRFKTIGFCAETNNLLENAIRKLKEKNLDMIIANDVTNQQAFGKEHNEVYVIGKDLIPHKLSYDLKSALADKIVHKIYKNLMQDNLVNYS